MEDHKMRNAERNMIKIINKHAFLIYELGQTIFKNKEYYNNVTYCDTFELFRNQISVLEDELRPHVLIYNVIDHRFTMITILGDIVIWDKNNFRIDPQSQYHNEEQQSWYNLAKCI